MKVQSDVAMGDSVAQEFPHQDTKRGPARRPSQWSRHSYCRGRLLLQNGLRKLLLAPLSTTRGDINPDRKHCF